MTRMPDWKLRTERFAYGLESKPWLIVALLTGLYIFLIFAPLHKPLWHDELYTFYIAQSPSVTEFLDAVRHIDLQPPLIFVTVWLSQNLFGINEFATRLPSVVAFLAASIGLILLLKRYVGTLWAAVPVLLLWFSFYFKYSTEARPYGLLSAFFVLSLYCYDRAIDSGPSKFRNWCIAGLLIGNICMMLSHVLAPFSIMPFGVAELVRTAQRRRIDWAVWMAILAPLSLVVQSMGMVGGFEKTYFPVIFQASPRKIVIFFAKAVSYVWPLLILGCLAVFSFRGLRWHSGKSEFPRFGTPRLALIAALLLPPVLVNFAIMRSAGAFWERYCITTALAIYVLLGLALAWIAKCDRIAAAAVVLAMLIAVLVQTAVHYQHPQPMHTLEAIPPNLPLVAAGGVTFLEMDHYENSALLKRTFYLTDRASAIQYAHSTLFEGFDNLRRYFPIRAAVARYPDFISQNKHFLVFGTPEEPEQWLFAKLTHDGAVIHQVKRVPNFYVDWVVYDVTMP